MDPQSPAPRPSLLPPQRRRDIVRWLGGGLAGLFFVGLISFPEVISRSIALIPPWTVPFLASALFGIATLIEFSSASSAVPPQLKLALCIGAVLAGFVWTWAASLINNYWFGMISFIVMMLAIRVAADHLIKLSAREK